jgi:hypothetical protein
MLNLKVEVLIRSACDSWQLTASDSRIVTSKVCNFSQLERNYRNIEGER